MRTLRQPGAGQLKGWTFLHEPGRSIRIRLRLKNALCISKALEIYVPVGMNLMFHKESEHWYVASLDGKKRDHELTKILNEIFNSLAIGMNKSEWEMALPRVFGKVTQYSIANAMDEYFDARKLGSARIAKAKESTIRGITGARNAWKQYGRDMEIFRFQKAVAGDGSEDWDLKNLLWGYIDYLRAKSCSVATQKNYLGYVKDALRYVAEVYLLALPDLSKISAGQTERLPISITNEETLKALANLNPDDYDKQWQQEAAIVAKLMFLFGYRIGDATKITRNNFQVTDDAILIRINSQKSRTPTIKLVPEDFYQTILKYMNQWGGNVVATQVIGTNVRLREGIKAIVKDLPGMDEMVEVLRQKPDKSTELVWVPIREEFKPHMLRATSGTLYHLITGRGADHLGNTDAVFRKHYRGSGININSEKEFHARLGL